MRSTRSPLPAKPRLTIMRSAGTAEPRVAVIRNTPARRDPWLLDSSVSDGSLGSLFDPWGDSPIGTAHANIAAAYGVPRALISTNGTTALNKLALWTLVDRDAEVLVERDCHVSVLQTLNEIGAHPRWLVPPYDDVLGINLAATPEAIARVLDRYPVIRAVHITSPKYFGAVGDLAACVAICHARGVKILVDEAHGACLHFHERLPVSGVEAGADLVTQSTHKTTEAWSQGSVLLVGNEALVPRLLKVLHGTASFSTSFNFGIAASVEEAIAHLANDGRLRIERALAVAAELRAAAARVPGIRTWGDEQAGRPGFRQLDPLRVTLDVRGIGLTGIEVEKRMQADGRRRWNGAPLPPVVAELGDLRNLLLLVTGGNSPADCAAAVRHLERLAAEKRPALRDELPTLPRTLPQHVVSPREAYWALLQDQVDRVPVTDAIGRVSAECVAVYPPGNALLVHGETVTAEVVTYLVAAADRGAHLKGATDPSFRQVNVLRDAAVAASRSPT